MTRRRATLFGQAGFSLIETLVAFAIMGLSLGLVFQIFSTGLDAVDVSESHFRATLIGESKLAAVGVEEELTAGERSGEEEGGFDWVVSVVPFDVAREIESEASQVGALYEVTATITWSKGAEARQVVLKTLKLSEN